MDDKFGFDFEASIHANQLKIQDEGKKKTLVISMEFL